MKVWFPLTSTEGLAGLIVIWSRGAAEILQALLMAAVKPELVAVKVKPVPARLMLRPGKVATPLTAVTEVVPERVALLEPVPEVIARVTLALEVVTGLPLASSIVTTGDVAKAVPAVLVVLGWVVKASLVAVLAVTVTEAVPVFPPAVAWIKLG